MGRGARGCHVAVAREQKIATDIRRGNGELARRIGVEVGRHFLSIIEPGSWNNLTSALASPLPPYRTLTVKGCTVVIDVALPS